MLVMISQPMQNRSKEEILKERKEVEDYIRSKNDTVFVNTINTVDNIDSDMDKLGIEIDENVKMLPIYLLSYTIKDLSKCDAVIFMPDWENCRACAITHEIAIQYGITCKYYGDREYEDD